MSLYIFLVQRSLKLGYRNKRLSGYDHERRITFTSWITDSCEISTAGRITAEVLSPITIITFGFSDNQVGNKVAWYSQVELVAGFESSSGLPCLRWAHLLLDSSLGPCGTIY